MVTQQRLLQDVFLGLSLGSFPFGVIVLSVTLFLLSGPVYAADGAAEALELRVFAERAIADELSDGDPELAGVMKEILAGMLVDHLVTRDETIILDTVDAAFIEEQFGVAAAMEEPGVAMALDVFAGPGTGYEHGIRTSITNLADFHLRKTMDGRQIPDHVFEVHERVMKRQQQRAHRLDKINDARLELQVDQRIVEPPGLALRALQRSLASKAKGPPAGLPPQAVGPPVTPPGGGAPPVTPPGGGAPPVTPPGGGAPPVTPPGGGAGGGGAGGAGGRP